MQSVDENRSDRELCVYCSDAGNKYCFILQVTLFNMYFRNLSCLMFPLLFFHKSYSLKLAECIQVFVTLVYVYICINSCVH